MPQREQYDIGYRIVGDPNKKIDDKHHHQPHGEWLLIYKSYLLPMNNLLFKALASLNHNNGSENGDKFEMN